jgi:hypothetical protein
VRCWIKTTALRESVALHRTIVGWQGIRFNLPPDWNVTGFSMERDSGYLRVDAPGNSAVTVQIRWSDATKPQDGPPTGYTLLAPVFRRWLRRPEPPVKQPSLKSNLERMFQETAKQAKKAKAAFESSIKPERREGPNDERTAMNFSWTGAGRGQGKIWYCSHCHRVVIAQVVGAARDQSAIAAVASQLFASLHDHAEDGYDLWALYDLQLEIPADFRLLEQKLLSGYLSLTFGRNGEKIIVDRWGLANMTLKKFTLEEWFRNNAQVGLKKMASDTVESARGHSISHYRGGIPLLVLARLLRDSVGSLRNFPTRYEGGAWTCPESNKIFALQTLRNKRSDTLWREIADRCVCHIEPTKALE